MKLSIFTTVTRPHIRGDNAKSAIECYNDLADELIIVDGGVGFLRFIERRTESEVLINSSWPQEFPWEFIGQQFQKGYEAATGDWVIHADLDFIFHEKDFGKIRQALKDAGKAPALSFYKWQFILPDRYNLKSRLVIAVNKAEYGDRIKFNSGGDLCQPSLDGKELSPDNVPQADVEFYNYEKLIKTEDQIRNDVGRMARAWQQHFGEYKLGGPDDDSAYAEWLYMTVGRFNKPQREIPLRDHPKYVRDTIQDLQPENFGYNGFGNLGENNYVRR